MISRTLSIQSMHHQDTDSVADCGFIHTSYRVAMIGQLKGIVSLTKGRLSALSVAPASGISQPARMLLLQLLILAACGSGIWLLIQQLWGLSQAVVVLLGVDMVKAAIGAARAACRWALLDLQCSSAASAVEHSNVDLVLLDITVDCCSKQHMHPDRLLLAMLQESNGSSRSR